MADGSNPFSTRHTRPGVIPFLFAAEESLPGLLERLEGNDWWGEIVGPHGAGKSTLLQALLPPLQARGRTVHSFSLRQGQRALGSEIRERRHWDGSTQVIVDGYEQLAWWNRLRLHTWCRRSGAGLLVTAHRPMGLPTLIRLQPSAMLMRRLVRQLWPEHDRLITDREIDACFREQRGNIREALFSLYDLYESRTHGAR